MNTNIILGALIAIQLCVWTAIPSIIHLALPVDMLEGYAYGKEHLVLTFKHPALPSWILEASRRLTGFVGWPAYLASQVCVCFCYLFLLLLGRDLVGARLALAAPLLASGCLATSWLSPNFNHDIAQLPLWTGFAWLLWRAVASNLQAYWLGAAVSAALIVYAKLSGSLLLLSAAVWLLVDSVARARLVKLQCWVAFAAFVLLVLPLAFAMIGNGGQVINYGLARASGRTASSIPYFLLRSGGLIVGCWIILLCALSPRLRSSSFAAVKGLRTFLWREGSDRRVLFFTFAVGPAPFLMLTVIAAIGGLGLKSTWVVPSAVISTLFVVTVVSGLIQRDVLVRMVAAAAGWFALIAAAYSVNVLFLQLGHRPEQVNWPQAEISRRLALAWQQETGGRPLQIVAGDPRIAAMVAVGVKPMPSLLWQANLLLSPRISADQLARQGALLVWDFHDFYRPPIGSVPAPPEHYRGMAVGPSRVLVLPWPRSRNAQDLVIGYAILQPATK